MVRHRGSVGSALIRQAAVGITLICATAIGGGLVAGPAGAEPGWSRTPGSALADTSIGVASSAAALCQWIQPPPTTTTTTTTTTTGPVLDPAASAAPDAIGSTVAAGDPIVVDGSVVELRLVSSAASVIVASLTVTPGGAWAGQFSVPRPDVAAPGTYDLIPRCVVDDPSLDGVRSYDFDPLPFEIVEGPPPTTVVVPTEIDTPTTATNTVPTQVLNIGVGRPAATAGAPTKTLPNTGDGTLAVALAGFGALTLGAGTLWWGSRHSRRDPTARPHA